MMLCPRRLARFALIDPLYPEGSQTPPTCVFEQNQRCSISFLGRCGGYFCDKLDRPSVK